MKNKSLIVICLLFFMITNTAYSQVVLNKTAQSTMNFLLVATSSKAAAMGEAFTSIGTGSESMFFNPAGLADQTNDFDINLNYTQWIADMNYLSGGIAWNMGNYGMLGVHLLTVDYGTINGTSLPLNPELYPLGFKDDGPVSNVGAYVVGLSYAKAVSREFSIGGTIKIAGQNLGVNNFSNGVSKDNNSSKLVFDAGIKYKTGFRSFMFGMYIRNFATNIKRELVEEQLPLIFSLGFAMNLLEIINSDISKNNILNIAVDFLHPNNYTERVNLGIEYKFLEMVSLRGGYQTNRDLASWSGGIGLNTSLSGYDLELSYSYSKFEIFNNVNRISLIFSF